MMAIFNLLWEQADLYKALETKPQKTSA